MHPFVIVSLTSAFFDQGFFDQGDRVYAIISELEDNGVSIGRVSISTKELERYPGEMLENKASVFETAEERVSVGSACCSLLVQFAAKPCLRMLFRNARIAL